MGGKASKGGDGQEEALVRSLSDGDQDVPIPRCVEDITLEWLKRCLLAGPEAQSLGEDVINAICEVKVEPLLVKVADDQERPNGGGLSGASIVRLRLKFIEEFERTTDRQLPKTLVVKHTDVRMLPQSEFGARFLIAAIWCMSFHMYRAEPVFYLKLRSLVNNAEVKIPRCYFIAHENAKDTSKVRYVLLDRRPAIRSVCVMEDLSGYASVKPYSEISLRVALVIARNVARLHQVSWRSTDDLTEVERFGLDSWAPNHQIHFGLEGTALWKWKQAFGRKKYVSKFLATWRGHDSDLGRMLRDDPEMQSMLLSLRKKFPEVLPQLGNKEPLCIAHGDLHHWNHMFRADQLSLLSASNDEQKLSEAEDLDMVLVDWQLFGPSRPSYELIWFLHSSMDANAETDMQILRCYHKELTSKVSDYSWEELQRDYELGIIDFALASLVFLVHVATAKRMDKTARKVRRRQKRREQRAEEPNEEDQRALDFMAGGIRTYCRALARLKNIYSSERRHFYFA